MINKKTIISWAVLLLVVLVLFFLANVFSKEIESLITGLIGDYGLLAIFFVVLIIELTPQPLGPEVALLAGAFTNISPLLIIPVVLLASYIGSFIDYYIGKFSQKLILNTKNYKKACAAYKKYGVIGLFIASIGPVPYVPFCWLSGSFNLPIKKFVYYGLLPRSIRIIIFSIIFTVLI
ncbi:DedA family protein [Candidatus Woesearchaeota archaeon]|nr:DedA family protein [Candidatus Woesearchaeota archaeon]